MQKIMKFDKIIDAFFKDVDNFLYENACCILQKRSCRILYDPSFFEKINRNRNRILMISSNPKKFTDKHLMDINCLFATPDGFLPFATDKYGMQRQNKSDTKLFDIYQNFIDELRNYCNSSTFYDQCGAGYKILSLYQNWKIACKTLNKLHLLMDMHKSLNYFTVREQHGR